MNAWLPGTATYTPFSFPAARAGRNIRLLRRGMVEHVTKEMGTAPSEWRWAREGDAVIVVAAKEEDV